MSQTNTPGEENDERDSTADDFDFYFPFAKSLALDLSTPEETSIAASWVQKLEAEPESEEEKRTRLNYLKLLIFVLQRGHLTGVFRKQPPLGALQPFPQGLTVLDVGNLMLDQDDSPTCGEGDARCLPYMTELSNDLREFVAAQDIPDFGIQMYYAWSSDEPVHKWLGFDEEKFPQFVLDKIKQLKKVKSDEKSSKDDCNIPKTGCDIPLMDKSAKKKVKSPQEIEKSQGRSFHTYVGLMGQMGNFNDKCGDDQDKCPRPEQRKSKCTRRNLTKEYMGSGGEAEDMPTEDEVASFLAGPGTPNRPCLCPVMGGRPHYPDSCGKGAQQNFQDQTGYNFPVGDRNQAETTQWAPGLESTRLSPRQFNEEQCSEGSASQPLQISQRRSPSPRPKSNSSNRPNYDCPLQDDSGFYKQNAQTAVCCCSSPPCTCPCPRAVPQQSTRKSPSSMATCAAGGRVAAEPSIACGRPSGGGYPSPGAGPGPSGAGRSGGSPRQTSRSKSPQVVHCFDNESPDPFLTQAMSKIDTLSCSEEGDSSAFYEDFIKDYFAAKTPPPAFQRLSSPQREHFDACQQQQQQQQPKAHSPVCTTMKPKDRCSPPPSQRPRNFQTMSKLDSLSWSEEADISAFSDDQIKDYFADKTPPPAFQRHSSPQREHFDACQQQQQQQQQQQPKAHSPVSTTMKPKDRGSTPPSQRPRNIQTMSKIDSLSWSEEGDTSAFSDDHVKDYFADKTPPPAFQRLSSPQREHFDACQQQQQQQQQQQPKGHPPVCPGMKGKDRSSPLPPQRPRSFQTTSKLDILCSSEDGDHSAFSDDQIKDYFAAKTPPPAFQRLSSPQREHFDACQQQQQQQQQQQPKAHSPVCTTMKPRDRCSPPPSQRPLTFQTMSKIDSLSWSEEGDISAFSDDLVKDYFAVDKTPPPAFQRHSSPQREHFDACQQQQQQQQPKAHSPVSTTMKPKDRGSTPPSQRPRNIQTMSKIDSLSWSEEGDISAFSDDLVKDYFAVDKTPPPAFQRHSSPQREHFDVCQQQQQQQQPKAHSPVCTTMKPKDRCSPPPSQRPLTFQTMSKIDSLSWSEEGDISAFSDDLVKDYFAVDKTPPPAFQRHSSPQREHFDACQQQQQQQQQQQPKAHSPVCTTMKPRDRCSPPPSQRPLTFQTMSKIDSLSWSEEGDISAFSDDLVKDYFAVDKTPPPAFQRHSSPQREHFDACQQQQQQQQQQQPKAHSPVCTTMKPKDRCSPPPSQRPLTFQTMSKIDSLSWSEEGDISAFSDDLVKDYFAADKTPPPAFQRHSSPQREHFDVCQQRQQQQQPKAHSPVCTTMKPRDRCSPPPSQRPLTFQTMSKIDSLSWSEEADTSAFSDDQIKDYFAVDKTPPPAFQRLSSPQREHFDACQQQQQQQQPKAHSPVCTTMKPKDRGSPPPSQRPLTFQTMSKLDSLSWSEEGDCSAFSDDLIKDYFAVDKTPPPGFQRLSSPQREHFDACQQQQQQQQPKAHSPVCTTMKPKDRGSPPPSQRPLTFQTMSKLDSLSWSEEGDCSAFSDDLIKDYFAVDKTPPPGFQRLSSPQREHFDACQQQQQPKGHPPVCPSMKGKDRGSPPPSQRPRTPPTPRAPRAPSPASRQPRQEPQQQCRPIQQFAPPPQARPQGDVCGPSQGGNQPEDPYAFLDKFPPECDLTPPPFENVFRRPPANTWTPESPRWNQPENLYDFMDKFTPNLDGSGFTGVSFSDDDCGRITLDTTSTSRNGSHLEDMYAALEKRFPPNASACAPSKPNRPRSAVNDVCGRPQPETCPPQSQAEDMYGFPPSGPSPGGYAAKSNRQRPDTCPPPSQAGNQPEDLYAFLEKNFPPRVPCPPNRKSGRMNNGAPQGTNQRREAHGEKCDTSGPRRSPGPDTNFCMQSGQPQGGGCPIEGGMMGGCCGESRAPRSGMFPDSGGCRRHPGGSGAMDRGMGGPPNRACQNLGVPHQNKNATFASTIHPPSRHPMGQTFVNDEEEDDECDSSVSVLDLGPKESMSMYGLSCPMPRGPGRPPQQGNAQLFERQQMMQGRSPQQQQCPVVWQEMQSRCPRPGSQRSGRSETPRPNTQADMRSCAPQRVAPWKTLEREQCTHTMGEVQKTVSKRISQGKACAQEINTYGQGNVEACPRRTPTPRKAVDESSNEAWVTMQSRDPQMDRKAGDEQRDKTWVTMTSRDGEKERSAVAPNDTWVTMPGRDPPTERRAVEGNKAWVTMPSTDRPVERSAVEMNETWVTMASRDPHIERIPDEGNDTWVTMPSRDAQIEKPQPSFRGESHQSIEPEKESCPPQNLSPGPPAMPGEVTEDWPGSGRDACEDDEQPLWASFEPSSKSGAERPVPKEPGIQRKDSGKPTNKESMSAVRRTSPRIQPSKNKLSGQKSSSRTYQSLTNTQSRSVRKPNRSPPNSECRSDNQTATKSRPKTKSESRMKITPETPTTKIKPETQKKIKPETQKKIGSDTRMKSRNNSKQKLRSISKDLVSEKKRRTSQMSSKEQKKGSLCRIQVVQDCPERLSTDCRRNPYMEKSLAYHTAGQAEATYCSPMEFTYSGSQILSITYQEDSPCHYDNESEPMQMKFSEDQTDLSAGSCFDVPESVPQNAQCQEQTYYVPNPARQPGNPSQGVSLQTYIIPSSDVYCDETDDSAYQIYYDE